MAKEKKGPTSDDQDKELQELVRGLRPQLDRLWKKLENLEFQERIKKRIVVLQERTPGLSLEKAFLQAMFEQFLEIMSENKPQKP